MQDVPASTPAHTGRAGDTPRKIRFLKIYGERNTGTNWHEQLLRINFPVEQLHHRTFRNKIVDPKGAKDFEAKHDAIFKAEGGPIFGWKHTAPSVAQAKQNPRFEQTGFVLITKNPYWFIRSLHRRPYNRLMRAKRAPNTDLETFAALPWPLLERDGLKGEQLDSPAHLWNAKTRALLTFAKQAPERAILIRYEDTLIDPQRSMALIAEKFGLHSGPYKEYDTDAKSQEDLGTDYYRKKYLSTDYEQSFSRDTLIAIDRALDRRLMARLKYARPKNLPFLRRFF